jgi:DNA glycosylase AlkZ-like
MLSAKVGEEMELAGEEVRRLRMLRQYLWNAVGPGELREVVRSVVGINAQRQSAMMLSLRARIRGLEYSHVEAAITETRDLVATWAMRGTIHLLDSRDIRCLIALLGRTFITASKGRRTELGLNDDLVEKGCAEILAILHGKEPMTRWELMDELEGRGFSLDRKSQAPIHLIRSAALKGLVCLGPYRLNGEPTYVLLDEWITNFRAIATSTVMDPRT